MTATIADLWVALGLRREGIEAGLTKVIEANTALRKRRALAKPERTLAAALRKAFTAEGRAVLAGFAKLKPKFPKAIQEGGAILYRNAGAQSCTETRPLSDCPPVKTIGPRAGARFHSVNSSRVGAADSFHRGISEVAPADDLVRLFDRAVYDRAIKQSTSLFVAPIDAAAAGALEAGMAAAALDLSLDVSFTLKHPEAVKYLKGHGAEQVTKIRETTREGLRSILTQAADNGWSYDEAARAIRERYKHFSLERALNIAVFELGDAYEHGNMLVGKDLQAGGLDMQKSWLSAGDDRVRPDHQANQGQGWIDLDDAFENGSDRPPTDPKCRCALLMRRKPDA